MSSSSPPVGGGLIRLDKPSGVTSHRALEPLKRLFQTRRIGHVGTLDRFATGLLVVLIGKATRFAPILTAMDKEYEATIIMGKETTTLDPEGEVSEVSDVIPPLAAIKSGMENLLGEIEQIPPCYSALRLDGERVYKKALRGESITLAPRKVIVHRAEILSYTPPYLTIRLVCSKGTYVRAYARDLGQLAGSCASLHTLRRTRVGRFRLEGAPHPDVCSRNDLLLPAAFLDKIDADKITLCEEKEVLYVRQGRSLEAIKPLSLLTKRGPYGLFDQEGHFVALVEKEKKWWRYHFVV